MLIAVYAVSASESWLCGMLCVLSGCIFKSRTKRTLVWVFGFVALTRG